MNKHQPKEITMSKDLATTETDSGIQSLTELLFQLDHEIEKLEGILTVAIRIRDYVEGFTQDK